MDLINFTITRNLHAIFNGAEFNLLVTVGGIEKLDDHTYICHFSVPRLGFARDRTMGTDPLQAIQLCLRTIDGIICGAVEDGIAEIWWMTKGDNGGFGR